MHCIYSQRTYCSAIHFPLSWHVRDLHPLERAHGAQTQKRAGTLFRTCSQTVDKVPVFAGTFTMSTVFLV